MARERDGRREEEAVLLLNKGKRGLLRVVFGRTMLLIVLMLLQVWLLGAAFLRMGEYYFGSVAVISLAVSLVVVSRRRENPASKITWILLIMALPALGVPLYFYVQADLGYRLVRRRLQQVEKETAQYASDGSESLTHLAQQDRGAAGLASYMERITRQPVYENSGATYLPTGEAAFEEMLRQLEQAEHFVFLEFFIIAEGYMWGRMLRVLERKAKQGVEIRVMYDGSNVIKNLPYHYLDELRKLGIQCKMFAPPRPLISTYYNNRDHRKILVIDGRVAFTGGVNLADEYINRTSLYGHWKDNAVMVTGEAVRSFTLMFLQMWNVEASGKEDYLRYLDASRPVEAEGFVLPYGDSPFDEEYVGETVYLDIINRAADYVHIMTPYLIIDNEMITALTFAAKRGVEVKLILPGIPDKKTVFGLTRSYYRELMEAGVEIWEYTPGFVHGKVCVSDDKTAVVGSINFDFRSLYLHFECAALLYGCGAVKDAERDLQETMEKCRKLTLADCRRGSALRRLISWLLRPLAPLM